MFVKKNNISETATFNVDNIYKNLLLDTSTGIIYDSEKNFEVVCNNQLKFQKINNFDQIPKEKLNNSRVYYSEDGTVIRLYYYNGNWRTATNNCSNALFSKWTSNKSFDSMFWELFEADYLKELNVDMTYIFVLKHKNLQNIIKHDKSDLIYICNISRQLNEGDAEPHKSYQISEFTSELGYNIYFPNDGMKSCELDTTDLEAFVDRNKRGLLFYCFDDDMLTDIYQYDFKYFNEIDNIKKNNPNIINAFITLYSLYLYQFNVLTQPDISKRNGVVSSEFEKTKYELYIYENHYKNYKKKFENIKNNTMKMINEVYRLYVSSHIKHDAQIDETNKYFKTIKSIHYLYKNGTKINYYAVLEYITKLPVNVIKKLTK